MLVERGIQQANASLSLGVRGGPVEARASKTLLERLPAKGGSAHVAHTLPAVLASAAVNELQMIRLLARHHA
eukprot:4183300-Pyramimonas_sp.AAC.1